MAFGFVAVAHYDSSSSNSGVVAKPTGTADNDILFALLKHNANENIASVPSGWTQLGVRRWNSAASVYLYWKLAASEGSNYTFGFTTAARLSISVVAYRDGFDTADPIDVVSDTTYTTNDTTLRAASMSVTATGSPVIFLGSTVIGTSHTFTSPTVPDTFTEDVDYWETNGRGGRSISHLIWSGSGATGNMDATASTALTNKHAFAVALNPASGASEDVAAAGSLSITGAAVLNAAGSLAAAGAASITGAAILGAVGALLAAGSVSIAGAADLRSVGALSAAGSISIAGAADLDAVGSLAAAGAVSINGAADLTSSAVEDIAATGALSISGSADLDATGALLAAGSVVIVGSANLAGVTASDISAIGSLSITGLADLDATGALLAAGSLTINGLANLGGPVAGVVQPGPGGSGYPVNWQGKRRKKTLEEQPNLHLKKVLDDVVNELYGDLIEADVPKEVRAKAAKLVKPFVAKKAKRLAIPPVAVVDWAALEKDAARVRQIIALWRKLELDAEIEDEDEYLLLMS